MKTKQQVATAYVDKCLSIEDITDLYGIEPSAVKRWARDFYGETFRVTRRVNLMKTLAKLGYNHFPVRD